MSYARNADAIDSGIGMTAEQQAKLFEQFSQADASTAQKYNCHSASFTSSKRPTCYKIWKARGRIRDPSPDTSPPRSGLLRADALASAVGSGGEMDDDSAKGEPARSAINPTGEKSDKAVSKSWPSFSLSSLRTDLTGYIQNWVVRLRFAAALIAIRLNGAVTNFHGARSSQRYAASKRTGTLPRNIGRGSHSRSVNITLKQKNGSKTASG